RPRIPGRAAAPRRRAGRRGRGAADRRAGPGRRRVRGVPAGGAGGVRGAQPGDRPGGSGPPTGGGDHLEPHPRAARRPQAPLPVPLERPPLGRARGGDRPGAAARGAGGARPPGGGRGRPAAGDGGGQASGGRRDDRLVQGPVLPRRGPAGARDRRRHPRRPAQGPRRPAARPWPPRPGTGGGVSDHGPAVAVTHGLPVGTGRILVFCRAAGALAGAGGLDRDSLYWAGRVTMVARPEHLAAYDEAFRAWFPDARDQLLATVGEWVPKTEVPPEIEVVLEEGFQEESWRPA